MNFLIKIEAKTRTEPKECISMPLFHSLDFSRKIWDLPMPCAVQGLYEDMLLQLLYRMEDLYDSKYEEDTYDS